MACRAHNLSAFETGHMTMGGGRGQQVAPRRCRRAKASQPRARWLTTPTSGMQASHGSKAFQHQADPFFFPLRNSMGPHAFRLKERMNTALAVLG